jgi:hypothetical protein
MAVVTIRPGDTIRFEIPESPTSKKRKPRTAIGNLNGNLVKYSNAIITGTWSTGQKYPYDRALNQLLELTSSLTPELMEKVSPAALSSLTRVTAYIIDKPTRNQIYSLVHNIRSTQHGF